MRNNLLLWISYFLMIISLALGEVAIFDIKISWIFTVLTVAFAIIYIFKRYYFSRYQGLFILFTIFWILYALFLFTFQTSLPQTSSGLFSLIVNIVIMILLIILIKDDKLILLTVKAMKCGLYITIIIAVLNVFFGVYLVDVESDLLRYGNIPLGFFGNPNDFATFVVMGIFGLFLGWTISKTINIVELISVLFSIYLIYLAGSRGSLIGILVFVLLFTIFHLIDRISRNHSWVLMLSIIVVAIFSYLFIFLPEGLISFLLNIFSSEETIVSDIYRIRIVNESIRMFLDSKLLGVGPLVTTQLLNINPHNLLVEILVDYGLVVFSLFMVILVSNLVVISKSKRIFNRVLVYSIIPSFLVIGITSSSMFRIRYAWVLFTVIYIYSNLHGREPSRV